MKKPPILLPISLLILFTSATVLTVLLGIFGPLKEWQILVGPLAVLAAASIAYIAAMQKVWHDRENSERELLHARENSERELLRKRLGLYLKIEPAMRRLHDQAKDLCTHLGFGPIGCIVEVSVDEFRLAEPPELDEAFEYLDVFPGEVVQELRTIRNGLRESKAHWDSVASKSPWTWAEESKNIPPGRDKLCGLSRGIQDACDVVVNRLEAHIHKMAPGLPEQERMLLIYGDPD
jgi:hypothetical protein